MLNIKKSLFYLLGFALTGDLAAQTHVPLNKGNHHLLLKFGEWLPHMMNVSDTL